MSVASIGHFREDFNKFLSEIQTLSSVSHEHLLKCWTESANTKTELKSKCVYIYQKGKNPGSTCGDPLAGESNSYCKKHFKYENAPSSNRKYNSVLNDAKNIAENTIKPSDLTKPAQQVRIAQNAYGNFEHQPTSLVFNKEKKIYGRQVGNTVVKLSQIDVSNCNKFGFSYLPEALADPELDVPKNNETEIPETIKNFDDE